MRFISKIFHPNIYPDGRVCISILHAPGDDPLGYETSSERWSPVQSVEKVLLSVMSMLAEPNCESPANVDAAKMWRDAVSAAAMQCHPFQMCTCQLHGKKIFLHDYRVTRMVAEKIMLTSNSKFRHRPGWQANLTVKRNFKFRVNINYSTTIRVTLYITVISN